MKGNYTLLEKYFELKLKLLGLNLIEIENLNGCNSNYFSQFYEASKIMGCTRKIDEYGSIFFL